MSDHEFMVGIIKRGLAIEPPPVVVKVAGGVVFSVDGLPDGLRCEIHDYDTEGAQPSEVRYDENEDAFRVFEMER